MAAVTAASFVNRVKCVARNGRSVPSGVAAEPGARRGGGNDSGLFAALGSAARSETSAATPSEHEEEQEAGHDPRR
jgi:hypothetical protein